MFAPIPILPDVVTVPCYDVSTIVPGVKFPINDPFPYELYTPYPPINTPWFVLTFPKNGPLFSLRRIFPGRVALVTYCPIAKFPKDCVLITFYEFILYNIYY